MRKLVSHLVIIASLIITILSGCIGHYTENAASERVEVTFAKHVDGDTSWFNIAGIDTKVRYLAIDTEETVHLTKDATEMGYTASEYVQETLSNAKKIELEYDVNSDATDKYGRTLAWIWVDGRLVQEELVEKGLARVDYIYGDYKYLDQLYMAQKGAKEIQLGIWREEKGISDY